jgi:hypothetical protein
MIDPISKMSNYTLFIGISFIERCEGEHNLLYCKSDITSFVRLQFLGLQLQFDWNQKVMEEWRRYQIP